MRNIGVATSIVAEIWALRDGLMLVVQLGITQLFAELDAQVIVNLVLAKKNPLMARIPLFSTTAGTSWGSSTVSRSTMSLGRQIGVPTTLLEQAAPFLRILLF